MPLSEGLWTKKCWKNSFAFLFSTRSCFVADLSRRPAKTEAVNKREMSSTDPLTCTCVLHMSCIPWEYPISIGLKFRNAKKSTIWSLKHLKYDYFLLIFRKKMNVFCSAFHWNWPVFLKKGQKKWTKIHKNK